MPPKAASNWRKRQLARPWDRLELGIPASLHFCGHLPRLALAISVYVLSSRDHRHRFALDAGGPTYPGLASVE